MKLLNYPTDLFAVFLLVIALLRTTMIATNKRFTKPDKYLALCITFSMLAASGLMALYSVVLCGAVALACAVVSGIVYLRARRDELQTPASPPIPGDHEINEGLQGTLLRDSDPRPFPGTRLINS
jgi:hypothetical protein